ncbi:MAG: GIY-YIG nuclease family protein [Sphingobacteriia bacterium]
MNQKFTLKIHTLSDNPQGPRTLEKSNWNGSGILFPRSDYKAVQKRPELLKPGVYILYSLVEDEETGLPQVYIGESGNTATRLYNHDTNKDFWDFAIVFTGSNDFITVAHAKYLEYYLHTKATAVTRCKLLNSQVPKEPYLSEADKDDIINFAEHILLCINALGIHYFSPPDIKAAVKAQDPYTFDGIDFSGKGIPNGSRFIVFKGTEVKPNLAEKLPNNVIELRAAFEASGKLLLKEGKKVLTVDYEFNSPSAAASFVAGSNRSGNHSWKNKEGKTLGEELTGARK